jgi:hypothetical protein
MNKILFYLQILSLSLLFIKSNTSTFSSHGIGNGTGMGLGLKIFQILITTLDLMIYRLALWITAYYTIRNRGDVPNVCLRFQMKRIFFMNFKRFLIQNQTILKGIIAYFR